MVGKDKRSKFALVWWLDRKTTNILRINSIPPKFRKINEIVNFTWDDEIHNTKCSGKAKILAFGDHKELSEQDVHPELGCILAKRVNRHVIPYSSKSSSKSKKYLKYTVNISVDSSSTDDDDDGDDDDDNDHESNPSNNDDESETSSNVDAEPNDMKNNASDEKSEPSEWIKLLFPNEVTKRDIENQRNYLKVMEKVYELQHKDANDSEKNSKIEEEYIKPGISKEEIIKGSRVYLLKSAEKLIEARSKLYKENEWRQLVRLALYEMYGNEIQNYSAAGKRSSKPAINPTILEGLYLWANSRMPSGEVIIWKTYIKLVNSISNNKKRH